MSPRMAKVFGAAGEHAGRQSVTAFKRMFVTLLIVAVVAALCEGAMVTMFFTMHIRIWWIGLLVVTGILLLWLLNYANRRVDRHETDRLNWRKGALGEYEVGAELERLSERYAVFNDVNTEEFGNFDHIVVGPPGIFALETKNWTGLIATDAAGELTRNGKPASQPHIRSLEQKVMMLREQVLVLCRRNDLFVRGVMVFPKASVAVPFGKTRSIHCLRIEKLRDYIDNPKFSQQLSPDRVNELVRALNGIAGMDEQFGSRHSASD
jgi:hypothetical protein